MKLGFAFTRVACAGIVATKHKADTFDAHTRSQRTQC